MTPSTTPLQPQHFTPLDEHAQERFARSLVAHLNQSQEELPYVVTERLRAAREQAVAQRKRGAAPLRQYASAPQLQTAGVVVIYPITPHPGFAKRSPFCHCSSWPLA